MWTRRRVQPEIPAAGKNRRVAIVGGLDFATGRFVWELGRDGKKNQALFLRFLTLLVKRFRTGRTVVVLDNVGYHKTKRVQAFAAAYAHRLELLFLPTYSPNLNLIERAWGVLKDRFVANFFHETLERFVEVVEDACCWLAQHNADARRILGSPGITKPKNLRRVA